MTIPIKISDNSVQGNRDATPNASLGTGFHAHQVDPDRHPATACNLKIGTWNVQTLLQHGKLENVVKEMTRMKINILGLAETRWKGANILQSDEYLMAYSGNEKGGQNGVAIILDKETAKSFKGAWQVSDRVLVIKLNAKPFDIAVIQAYAPTSTCSDDDIDKFYEDLGRAWKQLKSQDIKVVMGDFNAKVGSTRIDDIVGPKGIGSINERGEMLVTWCRDHELMIANTWFENHPRRCWTWKSPGDRVRNQIDYILVPKRFRNAVKWAKSMPGADCGSDHIPVVSRISVKLRKLKPSKHKHNADFSMLKQDKNVKEKFAIAVENRFAVLSEIDDSETMFASIQETINAATKATIPKKARKHHKEWITAEILDLMEQRRLAKPKPQEYKLLHKLIKKKCNEAKEQWLNQQCQDIETNVLKDSKFVHDKIKDVSGKKACSSSGCIKAKDGSILMDKEDILERWSEYVQELFEDARGQMPKINKAMEGPPILKAEVSAALRKMKSGKASGPDDFPVEAITAIEDLGIDVTTRLFNTIYESGEIPTEMCKSVFITLPKSPGATECELHRTISLMSHMTKLLLRILMVRMRKSLRPEISPMQFGFVQDKGTRNAIFTMSMLIERCIEVQKDLYLCFIDYSKAFDKVQHDELFRLLLQLDIDGKDLRVVRNLYWHQTAAVRVGTDISEFQPIERGVRQGCVMSPDLFNLYSEMILREIDDHPGLKVNGTVVNNLRYADDTVLIAESEEQLQALLDTVVNASEAKGLSLNVKKTECMVVSKSKDNPTCNITSQNQHIKQVSSFKYLGYMLTADGKCETEIKRRIAMAKDCFTKLKPAIGNRNISIKTKIRILESYVWSILLYGCESWTLTASTQCRLEATEMWFLRRILRVSWSDHRTNESVLTEANVKRSLISTIRKRQLEFLGHLIRHQGVEHLALTGKIEGKKGRGKPRMTYLNSLNKWVNTGAQQPAALVANAVDRDSWKALIADVCFRYGT